MITCRSRTGLFGRLRLLELLIFVMMVARLLLTPMAADAPLLVMVVARLPLELLGPRLVTLVAKLRRPLWRRPAR